MKMAIVGMGVAGSYLAARLKDEHTITGYERLSQENFDAVCGWGTSIKGIEYFAKSVGLNFEDYILHKGKVMQVDFKQKIFPLRLKGLCSFNKIQFIKDMSNGTDIKFGKYVTTQKLDEEYDRIIDATGLIRPLLPKLKKDILIPCVQYKVKYRERPFDDFYLKPFSSLTGYLWYFPLGDGYAHVGAGDFLKKHNIELETFLKKYPGEVIKKTGRPVRITPPSLCRPFYTGKIVGVGESIGTVYPMLGEGIIPSLQCADLLISNFEDLQKYEINVLNKFKIYDSVFRLIYAKISKKFSLMSQMSNILSIFLHMKSNEDRYGLQVRLADMLKVVIS